MGWSMDSEENYLMITLTREEAQQVLDALEWCYDVTEWPANGNTPQDKAIETLRARLAQPEREWQGLTDEEIREAWFTGKPYDKCFRILEAKLKEKNT